MSKKCRLIWMSLLVTSLLLEAPARLFAVTAIAPSDNYNRAIQAFEQGNYRTALQLAKDSLGSAPDLERYHALIIQAMFALQDYDAAAVQVRGAVVSGPLISWQTLYYYYGDHVTAYSDQLEALVAFVGQHPNDANARLLLGYQYLIVGKPELARPQLAEVVTLSPFDDFAAQLYRQSEG